MRWTIKGFSTKTEPSWDLSSLSFAWLRCEVISSSPDWHSFIVLIVGSLHLGDPAWIMTSASDISLLMILPIIVSHCYFLHCSSSYLNALVLFLLSLHVFIGLLMLPLSFTRKESKEMKCWNIIIKRFREIHLSSAAADVSAKHTYKICHLAAFSNDFNGFSAEDSLTYTNKQTFSSGVRFPDLYSLSGLWVRNTTEWPELQWTDIFENPVEKPCVCLLNLYILDDFCVLLTDLMPSQQRRRLI